MESPLILPQLFLTQHYFHSAIHNHAIICYILLIKLYNIDLAPSMYSLVVDTRETQKSVKHGVFH